MKYFRFTILFVIAIQFELCAQSTSHSPNFYSQTICVPDSQFFYPEITVRAGLQASFKATFEIASFIPTNIHISGIDSISKMAIDLFAPSIITNLNKLIYLKDTSIYNLTIRYVIHPTASISTGYAELINDNELRIVTRRIVIEKSGPHGAFNINPLSDTLTLPLMIKYRSGKAIRSNILVERYYDGRKDSTVIVSNNYPSLEQDLLLRASAYSKEQFLSYAPNAKYYFIRFTVYRKLSNCDCTQYY